METIRIDCLRNWDAGGKRCSGAKKDFFLIISSSILFDLSRWAIKNNLNGTK